MPDMRENLLKIESITPFVAFLKKYYQDRPLTGVEIGVYRGENAEMILDNLNIKRLYLIDPYIDYPQYNENINFGDKSQSGFSRLYSEATSRLAAFKQNIEFVKMKSNDAASVIPDVDFVYIDGNHAFDYVKNDFSNYYPKIKPRGVIGGDNLEFRDVANVVIQFFFINNLILLGAKRRISYEWWGVKPAEV